MKKERKKVFKGFLYLTASKENILSIFDREAPR
jgi:hypothetical protein